MERGCIHGVFGGWRLAVNSRWGGEFRFLCTDGRGARMRVSIGHETSCDRSRTDLCVSGLL